MKKLFLITLICISFCSGILAQDNKISVLNFYLSERDLTANTHGSIVYDQNGEKCALIKIRTNQEGFSFDVGSLGITQTIQKKGEIWVYVPHGVKKITFFHNKLSTLEYDFNLSTLQGKTYILELQSKEFFDNVVDDNTKVGTLNLEIFPPTASVILNAIPVKLNEQGREQVQLYHGRYTYKITDENYYPAEGRIRITDNTAEQTLKLRMKQAFGWLDINCIEGLEGADIYVDNKIVDSTVLRNRIPVKHGKHIVRIENPLYFSFQTEFSIEDSTVTTLPVTLQNNYGTVTLNTTDPLAAIYVDGKSVGRGSWSGKVAAGNHTFECKRGAHETTSRVLNIGNGSNITVPLEPPVPIYGTLDLTTTPEGATVYINDTLAGTTPLLKNDVIIGEKQIRLEKEFYTTENLSAKIAKDSTTALTISMTNRVPVKITSNIDSAKIFLNDNHIGYTPFADTLNGGEYDFTLNAGKKYKPIHQTLDISPYSNEFHYKLKRDHTRANEIYMDFNYMLPTNEFSSHFYKPVLGFNLGTFFHNVNFEVGFGTNFYESRFYINNNDYTSQCVNLRSILIFCCNLGYSIPLSNRFRLTPQVGLHYNSSHGYMDNYDINGGFVDFGIELKSYGVSAAVSCRLTFAFLPFMGFSITPSYKIPVNESLLYQTATEFLPHIKDANSGLSIKFGILFFIKL